ncbi:ribonuclease H-like domain-containing protein [Fusarium oxysporum]|nr:ribonuclease H-like domain-containing protein [Fusarium oxysporum]
MEQSQDFKSLQESVQKSLISTIKTVNRIAAEDLSFQRTVNPSVGQLLEDRTSRILELSTQLLLTAGKACGVKAPKLEDVEDIEMKWRGVVDVVDSSLEKADTALDEYTGLVKRKEPPLPDPANKSKKPKSTNKVIRNANMTKPQLLFERKPDNFAPAPWKPMLTSKPNAKLSLEESLNVVPNEAGTPQYQHPYEHEIVRMSYPKRVFKESEPIMYQPVETTEATFVDTYEGVLEMLEELKGAKEIAIDLEHHDFRSYVGLVSLMQISTREKDWIVDTLQPWRHKLEVLNQVFTDPSVVKVFHGAYMDMVWLQRDLGLYVNGLFDTFFACEQLHYPAKSLAYLLSKFVDFDADKQYQLADWRIRPLPEEMMYYARSDTHYLLYIYDRVRNELVAASDRGDVDKDYIGRAVEKSKEQSLSRYEHPGYDEETGEGSRGWYGYIFKNSHLAFDSEQFAVFRALWKSPRINPPDAKALHSLLPLNPSLARPRFNEIWEQIKETKAKGGLSLLHFFTSMAPDSVRKNGMPIAARKTTKLPDLDGEVTVSRLTRSQLFGDMPISSKWDPSTRPTETEEELIPFPWQRFIQQGSIKGDVQHDTAAEEVNVSEQTDTVESAVGNAEVEEADEEFTLRRGQKRKSQAIEESEPSEEDTDSSQYDSDEEMQEGGGVIAVEDESSQKASRSARRKLRKAEEKKAEEERLRRQEAKKVRKAQKKQKKQDDKTKKFDAVPFDYSKATSGRRKGQEEGFRPLLEVCGRGHQGSTQSAPSERRAKCNIQKITSGCRMPGNHGEIRSFGS